MRDTMTLSERLKKARTSLGYTQSQMAAALHTSARTWQVYESGASIPGGKVLADLARLGINLNWLMTGEGETGQRKWPVRIVKEDVDFMGRPFEIGYDLDEFFGARVLQRLKSLGNQSITWLAEESKIDVFKLEGYIYKRTLPNVDEVIAIADILKVNPAWLAEKSPHLSEHESHVSMGKALEAELDDVLSIESISEAIDKEVSEYDFHLDQGKGINLLMTLFSIYSKDFSEKKDELFESIVKNLVKLCLPGMELPSIVEVIGHIELARHAVKDGDLEKARIEFMRGAKDWKELLDAGDAQFPDKMEEARQAFTDFVQSDPVYIKGLSTLMAVIKANPGIKQFDLYNACTGIDRKMIIYVLNFAIFWGIIERTGQHQLRVKDPRPQC